VRQAQALRELLRTSSSPTRPSVRSLFERRRQMMGSPVQSDEFEARVKRLTENLHNAEAALELARLKQAKSDEELQLLERQTNFLRRNARAEQFLATERAQKQLLGERMPFLVDQVETLRRTRDLALAGQDLAQ
jgi:hypothetical protein